MNRQRFHKVRKYGAIAASILFLTAAVPVGLYIARQPLCENSFNSFNEKECIKAALKQRSVKSNDVPKTQYLFNNASIALRNRERDVFKKILSLRPDKALIMLGQRSHAGAGSKDDGDGDAEVLIHSVLQSRPASIAVNVNLDNDQGQQSTRDDKGRLYEVDRDYTRSSALVWALADAFHVGFVQAWLYALHAVSTRLLLLPRGDSGTPASPPSSPSSPSVLHDVSPTRVLLGIDEDALEDICDLLLASVLSTVRGALRGFHALNGGVHPPVIHFNGLLQETLRGARTAAAEGVQAVGTSDTVPQRRLKRLQSVVEWCSEVSAEGVAHVVLACTEAEFISYCMGQLPPAAPAINAPTGSALHRASVALPPVIGGHFRALKLVALEPVPPSHPQGVANDASRRGDTRASAAAVGRGFVDEVVESLVMEKDSGSVLHVPTFDAFVGGLMALRSRSRGGAGAEQAAEATKAALSALTPQHRVQLEALYEVLFRPFVGEARGDTSTEAAKANGGAVPSTFVPYRRPENHLAVNTSVESEDAASGVDWLLLREVLVQFQASEPGRAGAHTGHSGSATNAPTGVLSCDDVELLHQCHRTAAEAQWVEASTLVRELEQLPAAALATHVRRMHALQSSCKQVLKATGGDFKPPSQRPNDSGIDGSGSDSAPLAITPAAAAAAAVHALNSTGSHLHALIKRAVAPADNEGYVDEEAPLNDNSGERNGAIFTTFGGVVKETGDDDPHSPPALSVPAPPTATGDAKKSRRPLKGTGSRHANSKHGVSEKSIAVTASPQHNTNTVTTTTNSSSSPADSASLQALSNCPDRAYLLRLLSSVLYRKRKDGHHKRVHGGVHTDDLLSPVPLWLLQQWMAQKQHLSGAPAVDHEATIRNLLEKYSLAVVPDTSLVGSGLGQCGGGVCADGINDVFENMLDWYNNSLAKEQLGRYHIQHHSHTDATRIGSPTAAHSTGSGRPLPLSQWGHYFNIRVVPASRGGTAASGGHSAATEEGMHRLFFDMFYKNTRYSDPQGGDTGANAGGSGAARAYAVDGDRHILRSGHNYHVLRKAEALLLEPTVLLACSEQTREAIAHQQQQLQQQQSQAVGGGGTGSTLLSLVSSSNNPADLVGGVATADNSSDWFPFNGVALNSSAIHPHPASTLSGFVQSFLKLQRSRGRYLHAEACISEAQVEAIVGQLLLQHVQNQSYALVPLQVANGSGAASTACSSADFVNEVGDDVGAASAPVPGTAVSAVVVGYDKIGTVNGSRRAQFDQFAADLQEDLSIFGVIVSRQQIKAQIHPHVLVASEARARTAAATAGFALDDNEGEDVNNVMAAAAAQASLWEHGSADVY